MLDMFFEKKRKHGQLTKREKNGQEVLLENFLSSLNLFQTSLTTDSWQVFASTRKKIDGITFHIFSRRFIETMKE